MRRLSDDEAFTRLNGLYERIIAFTDEDQLGMVIDDFNGAYLLADKSVREDTASGRMRFATACRQ